jgi:hypothetical protein
MDLRPYIENLQRQLVIAADAGGDDARALAERLIAPLDAAVRLTLLDVLAVAADEITCDLAPGSVEVRLRGRDPEFAVTPPPSEMAGHRSTQADDDPLPAARPPAGVASRAAVDADDGGMSRINLRMPDHLKARIDAAAVDDGLSVNAWLVRAAAAALDQKDADSHRGRRTSHGAHRHTGWAR